MDTSRKEHLEWCKQRALEYVERGDLQGAFASMMSDLTKHPETRSHVAVEIGMLQMISGQLNTPEKMRGFIEGFK